MSSPSVLVTMVSCDWPRVAEAGRLVVPACHGLYGVCQALFPE